MNTASIAVDTVLSKLSGVLTCDRGRGHGERSIAERRSGDDDRSRFRLADQRVSDGVTAKVDGSRVSISADSSLLTAVTVSKDTVRSMDGAWRNAGKRRRCRPVRIALMKIPTGDQVTSNASKVDDGSCADAIDTLNLAIDLTNPDDGEDGSTPVEDPKQCSRR